MIKVIDEYIGKKIHYNSYAKRVASIDKKIKDRTAIGSDFIGWERLDDFISQCEINKMIECAKFVSENYEILVVCGVGGSYLGPRAAIDAIKGLSNNHNPKILFIGHTFSSDYIHDILEEIKGKKFAINVISKSGSTTETSIAFRLLKEELVKSVGEEEAKKAIFVTTDPQNGVLRKMTDKNGYTSFKLPSNIGGRYSVLTPVGLFPMACAGIDIKKIVKGAKKAEKQFSSSNILENDAYKYAAIRYYEYTHRKSTEILITYEPRLVLFGEWYKQLFAESEGKQHKGLFPTHLSFSTDLHSIGQFIQDGSQIFFETTLHLKNAINDIVIPKVKSDDDGLNYLAGKSLNEVSEKAFEGVLKAHSETAKVPNVVIEVEKLDEETLGALFYFFEKSAAMSAYLLGVNPFNQPGVEVYKKNMFHLLGKKGY